MCQGGTRFVQLSCACRAADGLVVSDGVTETLGCGIIFRMNGVPTIEDVPLLVGEADFARSLNWSARSIAKAVANGTLFVVRQGCQQLYPCFFADSTLKRRQLIAVTKLLKDLDGFTKWQFFVTGKGSLGGLTPLAALRQGKLRQVKASAEGFAER
jgi:hypothetical protein